MSTDFHPTEPTEPPSDPNADLADLVARIRGGDEAAEVELVERFERGLTVVLRRRCGDLESAEDLVQDTFLVVLEKVRRGEIDDPERLAGFIHGTARNLLLNHRRKAGRLVDVDEETLERRVEKTPGPRADQLDALLQREEARLVRELLAEMTHPRDRQVLVRFYLSQQPKEAICADLDIEPGHFRRVLYRARERLRESWTRLEKRQRLEREVAR